MRGIAKGLGISTAYLSYMVNGKRPWRSDLYARYCQLVNTSVNSRPSGVDGVSLNSATINGQAPVAQRIERLPSKQRVAGSNPAWGATSGAGCQHRYNAN